VIDQFLAPIPPDTSNTGERRTQLALEFFQAMQDCRSASDVQQFILLANLALNPQQASTAQQTLKELKNHPGGQQFIEGKDDETLVPFFAETSASRLAQLRSYEILRELGNTYNQGWSRHILPNQGIARAGLTDFMPNIVEGDDPETNRREVLRRLIRQWELSSTRYFLCHAANQNLSKQIQAQYGGLILPTYRNALGLILDPVQRRFDSLQSFQLSQSPLTKENSTTNNTVELVEFSGALPRAKLFADWRQGVDKNSTADILFSPGYDPHMQVIIRQTGLPKPEMPSQTSRLPTVKFVEDNGTRVELKIPPTSCSAMLLLNDRYDPNWNVTIDGQTASLLQANNHARAVHLPSSAKNRTVIFSYHAPTLPIVPSFAALAIGLLIAGFGLKRRVTPKETKPDET
jgi:hypothetical protein